MKLTTFSIAAVAATLAMTACGNSKEKAQEADSLAPDSTEVLFEEVDVIDVVDDSTATVGDAAATVSDSESQSIIDQLKNSTTAEQAKQLAAKAKDYVQQLLASGKVEEAKAYLAKVGPYIKEKAPEAYKSMTSMVSDDAKQALKEKTDEAKQKAAEKADELKDKAAEKASAAKDALKSKLGVGANE